MLHDFLQKNQDEILSMTSNKILKLEGLSPSSELLQKAIPIFYNQLKTEVLNQQESAQREADLTREAKLHGEELQRLEYRLSHVVYVYGALCQAITELASEKKIRITSDEFKELDRCLDIAIAGAIAGHELARNLKKNDMEIERLGYLAHELRNALTGVNISLQLIKKETDAFDGTTGQLLGRSLKRIEEIIDRSLAEVRLRANPKLRTETAYLLQVVDQIIETANIEAKLKNQTIEVSVDPKLVIVVDQHMFYSALSNLIQNAIKYTYPGGKIQVRAKIEGESIIVEVEDECGGLINPEVDLFKPYEQRNSDKTGLGLGLAIAKSAIELNQGTIGVRNLPGKGCIFKITLPNLNIVTKLEAKPHQTLST